MFFLSALMALGGNGTDDARPSDGGASAFGCLYDFEAASVRTLANLHENTRTKVISQFRQKGSIEDGVVLLAGGNSSLYYYSDTEVDFRQESNFFYAFGYDGPDAVGMIDLKDGTPYLFIPDYDPNYEVWNGVRKTMEQIEQQYGLKARYVSQLGETIKEINPSVVYIAPPPTGANSAFDVTNETTADMPVLPGSRANTKSVSHLRKEKRTSKNAEEKRLEERVEERLERTRPRMPTGDVQSLLHEAGYVGKQDDSVLLTAFALARTAKLDTELEMIEIASQVSSKVHDALMRELVGWTHQQRKPFRRSKSVYEYTIASYFQEQCYKCGLRHQAYIPIVGTGANSAILHWTDSTAKVNAGRDLMLIDAGAMYNGYVTDITRTYPANGVFTPRQKDVYEAVLSAQEAAIALLKPGSAWTDISAASDRALVEGLLHAGMVQGGTADELLEARINRLFMPHGLGHSVGLDVHDPEPTPFKRPMVEGDVVTVEPGLYIIPLLLEPAFKNEAQAKYLNQPMLQDMIDNEFGGVRIEDVLVVTPITRRNSAGHKYLSTAYRTVDEIERAMRGHQ